MHPITKIHHITVIVGDPQKTFDFYSGVLGLRLVKMTVNFDDPFTYHLYFGDTVGSPGTLITFFPWGRSAFRGSAGIGQISSFACTIPMNAVDFWTDRLKRAGVEVSKPVSGFSEDVLSGIDSDGVRFQLVASNVRGAGSAPHPQIPTFAAITGIYGIAMRPQSLETSCRFLVETMGFEEEEISRDRRRFIAGNGGPGSIVDVIDDGLTTRGSMGAGSIHHVAWRVKDIDTQKSWRGYLLGKGTHATQIIDRTYFQSIYFHEPGGSLFEIATDGPGFLIDEQNETLGSELKLPGQYEPHRHEIQSALTPLSVSV